MQPDHVTFGIENEGNKAVLPNGELGPFSSAAILYRTLCLHHAVIAGEIDDPATDPGIFPAHFYQGAATSGTFLLHRESPNLQVRILVAIQRYLERPLI